MWRCSQLGDICNLPLATLLFPPLWALLLDTTERRRYVDDYRIDRPLCRPLKFIRLVFRLIAVDETDNPALVICVDSEQLVKILQNIVFSPKESYFLFFIYVVRYFRNSHSVFGKWYFSCMYMFNLFCNVMLYLLKWTCFENINKMIIYFEVRLGCGNMQCIYTPVLFHCSVLQICNKHEALLYILNKHDFKSIIIAVLHCL